MRALAFSPDGIILASGFDDSTIKIWQRDSNNYFSCIQTIFHHKNSVSSLAFSPDGIILASGFDDSTIKIWQRDFNNYFSCIQTIFHYKNSVSVLVFSPDRIILASGSDDSTIKIWQKNLNNSFSYLQTLTGHEDWLVTLAFFLDGTILASVSIDESIKIWMYQNRGEYTLLSTIRIRNLPIAIDFLKNNHAIIFQTTQGVVLGEFYALLDPQEFDLLIKIYLHKNLIRHNYYAFFNSLSDLEKITLSQIHRAALPDFFIWHYSHEGQDRQITHNFSELRLQPSL